MCENTGSTEEQTNGNNCPPSRTEILSIQKCILKLVLAGK